MNYIGDIFGTLCETPDFLPGSVFNDNLVVLKKGARGMKRSPRKKAKGKRNVDVRLGGY